MAQNQAVKTIEAGVAKVVDAPVPKLPADDYILVKTTAVAINPTDWKHVDLADKAGCVGIWVGCDYAGIVEEVGSGVTKDFKKGDRICGPVNGSNALREIDGAFAKYIAVKGDLQIKTPDNITDEEAATLGIAVTTVLSGYNVITTASPHNFDYLKELGASAVFDYKSPTVSEDIRKHTGDALTLAWDCQSTDESAAIVARALSSSKPSLVGTLLPVDKKKVQEVNPNADVQMSLYYTVFGEEFGYFGKRDAVPENYEFGKRFWELSRELLAEGKLKPIRVIKNRGGSGLDGVIVGLKELKEGKVSAGKLVYTI
uniref:Zinc-binding oxidoreductase n=1 Tax=Colletotrichum fructicola (strain Nara gc5) TaxID=1213859 RepID=L2FBV1_COLFN